MRDIWLPQVIVHTMDRIESALGHPWSLSAMARVAGLSPHHFHRKFRDATGETPTAFLERLRLERVALLLLASQTSITELAWQAGFRNPETLARRFRARFGITARDYRAHQLDLGTRLGFRAGRDPCEGPGSIRVTRVPSFSIDVRRWFGDDEGFCHRGVRWGESPLRETARFGVTLDWPGITDPGRVRQDWGIRHESVTPLDGWTRRKVGGGHYAQLHVSGEGPAPTTTYQRLFVWSMGGRYRLRPGPIFEALRNDEIVVYQPVTDWQGE